MTRLPLAARAVLAALVLAAPASASATGLACLTGEATLADQRALVAFRSATEAACPCAAAARAQAYRRCARAVLQGALDDGALRPECSATAWKAVRTSSCGTDRVACGIVRQGNARASCRIAPPRTCEDRGRLTKTACTEETHCTDVVDWTAGTCLDPREPGPFAPGYREVDYVKDSVTSPGTPRLLRTSIWYPAPAGSGPVDPSTGGVADAPLDSSGGPYPIVMFSHGSCGLPRQSKFLTPLLATHGFVVVAPPHPGNTVAELPDCMTPTAQVLSFFERPQDIVFVLDRILEAGADPASFLFGAVDGERIGMTGHSFGGLTTYLVTQIDPRFDAAVPMAPAARDNSVLPVPSLTILGAIDTVISNDLARAAYDRSVSPKLLVEIEHAGHFAFSDFCLPGSNCNPPTTLDSAEAHEAGLRWIVPFLQVHVAGDDAWAPLLAPPTRHGFVYTAG